jgi:hypothetical protein
MQDSHHRLLLQAAARASTALAEGHDDRDHMPHILQTKHLHVTDWPPHMSLSISIFDTGCRLKSTHAQTRYQVQPVAMPEKLIYVCAGLERVTSLSSKLTNWPGGEGGGLQEVG